MNAMEEQADNAKARDLYWKPLSWLGTMRPTKLAPYQAVKTSAVSTFFAVCFITLFLLHCFSCERFTTTAIAPCVAFATFGQVRLAKNFDSDSHCFTVTPCVAFATFFDCFKHNHAYTSG
jgi:hypothetical protein